MKPTSEQEALRFLKVCRFTVEGNRIIPERPEDISPAQAEAVDYLHTQHGYVLDDSPQPKPKSKFFDDNQVILFLKPLGYRFENGLITVPAEVKGAEPVGLVAEGLKYLREEWGYTVTNEAANK